MAESPHPGKGDVRFGPTRFRAAQRNSKSRTDQVDRNKKIGGPIAISCSTREGFAPKSTRHTKGFSRGSAKNCMREKNPSRLNSGENV